MPDPDRRSRHTGTRGEGDFQDHVLGEEAGKADMAGNTDPRQGQRLPIHIKA